MRLLVLLVLGCLLVSLAAEEDIVFEEEPIEIEEPAAAVPLEANLTNSYLPSAPSRKPFQFNMETLLTFRYEALAVLAIFWYLMIYRFGLNQNTTLIARFYESVSTLIDKNFTHVELTEISGETPIVRDSGHEAIYYASGRKNIEFVEMHFQMKKREDLLYSLYEVVFPEKDVVVIDIPVLFEETLVFAVGLKKKIKDLYENSLDLNRLTGEMGVANLNKSYEVLGQSAESVNFVLDNYTIKRLNDMSGLLLSLHYTDQMIYSQSKGHLRVLLNVGHKNPDHFQPMLELIFYIVDRIAVLQISANVKAKAFKARESFKMLKEKQNMEKHQDELRNKKLEKLKQEEAWLRSLPADKQKREDEKRKKKEFSKMMKGKTMKVA